jgi:endonuclease/exonuclease/phosphatase family metal-dependent hydrolase
VISFRTLGSTLLVLFIVSSGISQAQSLPASWSSADIGAVGAPGNATGSFTVAGGGADVWGSADAFRFAYKALTGDGSIVTQILALDAVANWTKGGVMMRESLAANSRHAFMLVSPGKGLAFQRRLVTGGDSTHTTGGAGVAPTWLKLTRTGNVFTGYRSADGVTWTLVDSDTIPMSATIYVGVAVGSHVYGVTANGTFAATTVAGKSTDVTAPSTPATTAQLRVLHWNTHHGGIRTDGVYDPGLIASWIAKMNPDIASLNEVDDQSELDAIVNALKARTGVAWYTSFSGLGNLVISRLPPTATSRCVYPDGARYSAHLATVVNGRPINVWSIHTTVDNADTRFAEVKGLQTCAQSWPEARILAGDYNMQEGSAEYLQAVTGYTDAWPAARALGTAINYSGNCDGCTRNSRIDYAFSSKGAAFLTVRSTQIFDTRDAYGVTPSDHKPMLVVYDVK